MKVLKLLISLSWCLGVCLQQILLVTFLGYPVDIMVCAISTIPNITYNQISDMIGNLVVLVSVEILFNISNRNLTHTMMEMLRYVTAWARWSTRPPLPTSPLRASFTTRCQLELEHKFRMDDWKQEDGTVKLVLILHAVWIDDLATIWIGLTKGQPCGLWFKFDIPADSCLFLSEKMHQ